MKESAKLKRREEISDEFKWAIKDLFQTDDDWKKEYDQVKALAAELSSYQGKLGESAAILTEFLQKSDTMNQLLERVYVYANQKSHEDTTNDTYQNLSELAGKLMVEVSSATSFETSEILAIPDEVIAKFFDENKELNLYRRYIDNILRQKPHILSEAEEKLLAQAGEMSETSDSVFAMFNNADIKFPTIKDEDGSLIDITHGRYAKLIRSKDRRVRKEVFEGYYTPYEQYKNTLAAMYAGNMKTSTFFANVRHYDSALAMALDDSNVPVKVYHQLIETVHQNMDSMYRYVKLRKKLLGLDEIHMYDLYTPIVGDIDMKVPFEEAKETVLKGLSVLGEEYCDILKEGFENSWIDVYENVGKRTGAYSWGAYGTHPYVLLNYNETLDNVFTLAHEMGHAIHSYYSDQTQNFRYASYKIFVAEVASTCNEALLMHYLLNHTTDKKEKAYLINYYLEQFKGTLYRQTMFAEFEKITHEMVDKGEALTSKNLCDIYHKLNELYFGDDIVIDSQIDMEWARIPHFYTPFYVYQYATGYSAAIALSSRILKEGEPAIRDYVNFLKGGSSKDPIDLLKGAGVDMTSSKPVNDALQVFKDLLDEMEELME
ncbi:oligoendopeptidase F [Lachnospiraceae bacterium KM106-2]|nr:oligoendopeptidase F [Lachnospiraceae bacterium KM106-2]